MQSIINPEFTNANIRRNLEAFSRSGNRQDYWSEAMIEEFGEMMGALKKLKRGFTERDYERYLENNPDLKGVGKNAAEECWQNELSEKFSKEYADLLIYMDLFAFEYGINVDRAVVEKFNEVSEQMKSKVFLSTESLNRAHYSKFTIDQ